MAIYKQSQDKDQDIGSLYGDSGKIQEIENYEIPIEIGGESEAEPCCSGGGGLSISGIDICDYVTDNCPAINNVSYDPSSQEFTFILQDGSVIVRQIGDCCPTSLNVVGNEIRFTYVDHEGNNQLLSAPLPDVNDCCPSGMDVSLVGQTLTVTVTSSDGSSVSDSVLLPSGGASVSAGALSASGQNLVYAPGDGSGDQVIDLCPIVAECPSQPTISGINVTALNDEITVTIFDSDGNLVDTDSATISDCCVSGVGVEVVGQTVNVSVVDTEGNVFSDFAILPSGTVNSDSVADLDISGTNIVFNAGDGTPDEVFDLCPVVEVCSPAISGIDIDSTGDSLTITIINTEGNVITSGTGPIDDCCVSGVDVSVVGQTVNVSVTDSDGNTFSDFAILPSGTVNTDSVASLDVSGTNFVFNAGDGTPDEVFDVCPIVEQCGIGAGISGLTTSVSGDDVTVSVLDVDGNVYSDTFMVDDCCVSGVDVSVVGQTVNVSVTDSDGNTFSDFAILPSGTVNTDSVADLDVSGNNLVFDPGDGTPEQVFDLCPIIENCQGGLAVSGISVTTLNDEITVTIFDSAGNLVDTDSATIDDCCVSGVNLDISGSTLTATVLDSDGNDFVSSVVLPESISTVNVQGCIVGDGDTNPLDILLDPSGGIQCGPSGLTLFGDGCCEVISYVTNDLPVTIPAAPQEPASMPVEGTVQQEVWNDAIIYWVFDGTDWQVDKVFGPFGNEPSGISSVSTTGCVVGDGTPGDPIDLFIKPSGGIVCTPSGLCVESCHADSFELGKAGPLTTDTSATEQHKRPFSTKTNCCITDAIAMVGTVASEDVTFEVYIAPPVGTPTFTGFYTLPSGQESLELTTLIGECVVPGGKMFEAITGGSVTGSDLNIVIWTECCPL